MLIGIKWLSLDWFNVTLADLFRSRFVAVGQEQMFWMFFIFKLQDVLMRVKS